MGDRSRVPPSGGMMPLNRLRYGSQMVLHSPQRQQVHRLAEQPADKVGWYLNGPAMAWGGLGNQVSRMRPTSAAL